MRRTLTLLIAALALLACHRKPSTPPDVIVRVGDRMVTLADFKRYIERNAGTDLAQVTPEVASAMLDQYVEEILLSTSAPTTSSTPLSSAAAKRSTSNRSSSTTKRSPTTSPTS